MRRRDTRAWSSLIPAKKKTQKRQYDKPALQPTGRRLVTSHQAAQLTNTLSCADLQPGGPTWVPQKCVIDGCNNLVDRPGSLCCSVEHRIERHRRRDRANRTIKNDIESGRIPLSMDEMMLIPSGQPVPPRGQLAQNEGTKP